MAKPKYHFLTVSRSSCGLSIVTLPGQKIGTMDITPGILVKDRKKQTVVQRLKRSSSEGRILFTSTLKRTNGCYTADDIHALDDIKDIMYSDAIQAYEDYTKTRTNNE